MGEAVLSDDALVEILLRASGECVFRCKCLSKQWNSYLSSPLFRRKYLSRRRKLGLETLEILGCFKEEYDDTKENPAASFHPIDNVGFVGASSCIKNMGSFVACSNGLILFRSCNNINTYYVCNPFTDKAIELPQPNRIYQPDQVFTSFHYHEETKEEEECARFSVVRTYPNHGHVPSSSVSIEVYSSETRAWKESTLTGPQPFLIDSVSEANSIARRDEVMVYWHTDGGFIVAYDRKGTQDSVWLIELPFISAPIEGVVCESDQGLLMCAVNHQPGLLTVKILPQRLHDYSCSAVVPESEWSPFSNFQYSLTPFIYPDHPHPRFVALESRELLLVIENDYLYTVNTLTGDLVPVGYVPNDYWVPYFVWNWPWPPSIP